MSDATPVSCPALARLLRSSEKFSSCLSAAGMGIFMLMILLTFIDVFLRYLLGSSLPGTTEITGLLMVVVVFASIAMTQWQKSHVVMDIFTSRLSERDASLLAVVTSVWSLATTITCIVIALDYARTTPALTLVLRLPLWPFILFMAFGFFLLGLALLHELLENLASSLKLAGKQKTLLALLAALVSTGMVIAFAVGKVPFLDDITVGLLGLIFLFILFILGMPVGLSLITTGLVFIAQMRGVPAAAFTGSRAIFSTAGSYAWSPLMFFMLMGYCCYYANFGKDIYNCARSWLGHYRGGLAMGSIMACTVFGAVVGDVLSGSIAMAAIALPEMRKYKYDDEIAVGTLACSGTIGCLIPPSTTFIIYGVLAQQSIGDLFIAGIIPGIVCMLCFMASVWLMAFIRPESAPRMPRASLQERMASLRSGLPILLIFIMVIGGIYGGVFTPTEGGGIGVCGTLLLAMIMRRITWGGFISALKDSAKFISMCFTILCGAVVLSYFMAMTRIPMELANTIAAMQLPGGLVLCLIVLVFLILGCFLPSMPLLLICVPIFVPIANVFGWDLIWFGVLIVILDNMASITPPFGINLFVMKEIADVPLATMYRAALPFVISLLICLLLIIFIPPLSTFLLTMMHS